MRPRIVPKVVPSPGGPAVKAFGSLTSANDPHPKTQQNKTDQTKETLNVPVRAAVRRHLLC